VDLRNGVTNEKCLVPAYHPSIGVCAAVKDRSLVTELTKTLT
jgi:hypothetical protein